MAGGRLYLRGKLLHGSTDYCFGCIHTQCLHKMRENKSPQIFSSATSLRGDLKCTGLHQSTT